MLKLDTPNYIYCPFCGDKLQEKELDGKTRKFCPKDQWVYFPHVATTSAAIIQKEDKVLLVLRNRDPYKNTWMFPAGFAEYGEHPSEVVKREAFEETGFKVTNSKLIDVFQVEDDYREPGHFVFFYKVDLESDKQDIIKDKEENADIRWFALDNLPEIGWHAHQKIAQLLKDKRI